MKKFYLKIYKHKNYDLIVENKLKFKEIRPIMPRMAKRKMLAQREIIILINNKNKKNR